ncbi:MAG: DNA photolyase [Desulfobacteraceae bacterium]|nr:MAG: DNA photolyase [Desulfobacteraceae bacterium]
MSIQHVYVDRSIADKPETQQFIRRLGLPPVMLQHPNELYEKLKRENDPCLAGKHTLLLTRNQGSFLRRCPGTRDYVCCGYHILNFGNYCTMDCAYCILQSYFHPPLLRFFVNHEDLWEELGRAFENNSCLRVGTGEFTDSLIWESWSDLTAELVERFARQEGSVLELKTKTTAMESLRNLEHNQKTIVSWSLNTPYVISQYESGTASLEARLRAAAKCESWGYPLAFHFDPIVLYPGCEKEYEQVIHSLFEHISADRVVWISMGTFRFMPALQAVVQERFPQSKLIHGEFVPGLDGKMRYFKPLRIQIYRRIYETIATHAPEALVYLCMEDEHVWSQSVGFIPQSRGGLPAMLDQSAGRHCGLKTVCTSQGNKRSY